MREFDAAVIEFNLITGLSKRPGVVAFIGFALNASLLPLSIVEDGAKGRLRPQDVRVAHQRTLDLLWRDDVAWPGGRLRRGRLLRARGDVLVNDDGQADNGGQQ